VIVSLTGSHSLDSQRPCSAPTPLHPGGASQGLIPA